MIQVVVVSDDVQFLAGVSPWEPSTKSIMVLSICCALFQISLSPSFCWNTRRDALLCKRLHLGISTSFSRVDIKNPEAFIGHKSHAVMCYTYNKRIFECLSLHHLCLSVCLVWVWFLYIKSSLHRHFKEKCVSYLFMYLIAYYIL